MSEIDAEDRRFSIGITSSPENLMESIGTIGQLYPVLIRERDSKYIIIDGFKRFDALSRLGREDIDAILFNAGEYEDTQLFLFHLQSIISSRSLNEVEKAHTIISLIKVFHFSIEMVHKIYAPLHQITALSGALDLCEKICSLGEDLKIYLIGKNVALPTLINFSAVDKESFSSILEIAAILKLGANKLRTLFKLICEVAFRDGNRPVEVTRESVIQYILSDPSLTLSQKWEHLYNNLYSRRYPDWSKTENGIKSEIARLKLPSAIKLNYPPYLEGNALTLEIGIKKGEDLDKIGQAVRNVLGSESLAQIFKYL